MERKQLEAIRNRTDALENNSMNMFQAVENKNQQITVPNTNLLK